MSRLRGMLSASLVPSLLPVLALPLLLIITLPGAAGGRGESEPAEVGLEKASLEKVGLEEVGLEEILNRVHLANEASQDSLFDYVCQSTFIMREPKKDGTAKTVLIQDKTIYFRPPDQEREIFLSVTKKGEVLSPEELAEYQQKADEEARQRSGDEDASDGKSSESEGTMSFSASAPWDPEQRGQYTFELLPPDTIRGIPAHTVRVTPREEKEDLVDGTAWFHHNRFEVLRLEFQPAKL